VKISLDGKILVMQFFVINIRILERCGCNVNFEALKQEIINNCINYFKLGKKNVLHISSAPLITLQMSEHYLLVLQKFAGTVLMMQRCRGCRR
jgi:hypothetical protein